MFQISLYVVGVAFALFFTLASNVLNYVSIATMVWTEDGVTSLWAPCTYPVISTALPARTPCFTSTPPVLIAIGTAFNCLSLVLMIVSAVSIFWIRFRNSYALYFVMAALVTTLVSLLLNSTGWYFIFVPQQQLLNGGNAPGITIGYKFGWSFWLMTPSFGCSILAAMVICNLLGCTYTANKHSNKPTKLVAQPTKSAAQPTAKPTHKVEPAPNKNDQLRF